MTVILTLTTAGTDTGPFNLYSDLDGYVSAFETGVLKTSLVSGYVSYLVPDGTTTIRVVSTGTCTNYIDIPVSLTTTTTTTIADPATSILSFTSYEKGMFLFSLSNSIPSTSIQINDATISGSTSSAACATSDVTDSLSPSFLTISAGSSSGTQIGLTPMTCSVLSVVRGASIIVNGVGTLFHGQTFTAGGTIVTVNIPNSCVNPYVCSLYDTWTGAKADTSLLTICGSSPITVYTTFATPIGTGVTVYTDSALTTPLSGNTYIVGPNAGNIIYEINTVTGVVGASTATTC